MLLRFFDTLRTFGVPISTRELLDLLAALRTGIAFSDQAAATQCLIEGRLNCR